MQDIGELPSGTDRAVGRAISRDGPVHVGDGSSGKPILEQRAARGMEGGVATAFDVPAGVTSSAATAVSHDGSKAAGVIQFGDDSRAVRWTPAGVTQLGSLPDRPLSVAYGTSDDGNV